MRFTVFSGGFVRGGIGAKINDIRKEKWILKLI